MEWILFVSICVGTLNCDWLEVEQPRFATHRDCVLYGTLNQGAYTRYECIHTDSLAEFESNIRKKYLLHPEPNSLP